MNPENNGTVLLIDVENVIGLCNTLKLEGTLDEIDIKPVCDKLTEMFGPLRYRKSFGDIAYSCAKTSNHHWIRSLRKNFYDNLVEIHDIPNFGGFKNMADMTIMTEALSIAFESKNVSVFAIFSSDADYVPLYTKLKERGKTVVIIGVTQEATSAILTKAADYLYYYKNLVSQGDFEAAGLPIPNYYRNLVLRAAATLLDQGVPLHGSSLLHKIRQLQSDFDYRVLGFKKFIDFLKDIESSTNAISVKPKPDNTGDMTIVLNETNIMETIPPIITQRKEDYQLSLAEEYKVVLEKKLRCPILSNSEYEKCCRAIEDAFRRNVKKDPDGNIEIKLVDLKNLVMPELLADPYLSHLVGLGKNTDPLDSILYKILKALYITGVFTKPQSNETEPVPFLLDNNPTLCGFYEENPNLLERLYFSMFYIIKSFDLPLEPNPLARLFHGSENKPSVDHMTDLLKKYEQQLRNQDEPAAPDGKENEDQGEGEPPPEEPVASE
ncbi:MAG: NYN domain-containing protein [Deltaproteobacteria bacterium]|nr:NYN domain-containing protein [Deltaproteobacteria bacterium]